MPANMSKLAIIPLGCYIAIIAPILFRGISRLRDEIALPLADRSQFHGSQLSLSAICRLASDVRRCGLQLLSHRASKAGRWLRSADCSGEAPRLVEPSMMPRFVSRGDAADELREQAACCRRLARTASTPRGSSALTSVAEYFDADARRIDPMSERR